MMFFNGISQKTYFRLNAGYAFPFVNGSVENNYSIRYELAFDKVIEEYQQKNSTFGKGANIQAILGMRLNEGLYFELGVDYFKSIKNKFTASYIYYNGRDVETYTHTFRTINIMPSLVLSHPYNYFEPYIGIGPTFSLPKGTSTYELEMYNGESKSSSLEYIEKTVTIGLHAKLGVNYPINEKWAVNFELLGSALVFQPDRSVRTSYMENKHDKMYELCTYEIETNYSNKYTIQYDIDPNGNLVESVNRSKPKEDGKFGIPLHSISLFAGVKYSF